MNASLSIISLSGNAQCADCHTALKECNAALAVVLCQCCSLWLQVLTLWSPCFALSMMSEGCILAAAAFWRHQVIFRLCLPACSSHTSLQGSLSLHNVTCRGCRALLADRLLHH